MAGDRDPYHLKVKEWNGKDLKGVWQVSYKIDGVRALWAGYQLKIKEERGFFGWYSRAGKPLYNIPYPPKGACLLNCEVYLGSFKDTIRAVRTQTLKPDTPRILYRHLFSLDPLDPRLDAGTMRDPRAIEIRDSLRRANEAGYEGLVLRQGGVWLKVKPSVTYDVQITGAVEGTGKHHGRLGALKTPMGEVGTGFTDEERETLWLQYGDDLLDGKFIEVECMHLTPDGMFRHPRFIRLRPDKDA